MVVIKKTKRKPQRPDPNSLAGKLVYFSGLSDLEEWYQLDQKLLLISEDQHDGDYNSSMVFGYIINQSGTQTIRDSFRNAGKITHHTLQMIGTMHDADQDEESYRIFRGAIHIITPKKEKELKATEGFTQFSAYEFEDLKDAEEFVMNLIKAKEKFSVSSCFVVIDREKLIELQREGFVKIRDAEPNIVFERHIGARAWLAFPEEFSFKF